MLMMAAGVIVIPGIAIIVGSGLYVFHRERRLARKTAPRIDQP